MKATNAKRLWRSEGDDAQARKAQRQCDHPGCSHEGEYRAPRARDRLNEYYWFCLDHVRAYNAAWDYYRGMSSDQIEREVRQDTTWQRQTWPLGAQTGNRRFSFTVHDPFEVFGEGAGEAARPMTAEEEAMRVMDLAPPLTLAGLKTRYKELVKRHHPDANGGDKDAEEKFKQVNHAYTTLLHSLDV